MKRIMFNDRYGLTEAVLQGRKTVTRRIMNPQPSRCDVCKPDNSGRCIDMDCQDYPIPITKKPPYKVGEIVAVAQSYSSFIKPSDWDAVDKLAHSKGWNNKMFVRADLMPHQIRILDVRAERLQDITDEDCLKEGINVVDEMDGYNDYYLDYPKSKSGKLGYYASPREAFASLIDKISGRGTWDTNPYVWRIEFELIK